MRINSVGSYNPVKFQGQKNNNINFTGSTQTKIVNVGDKSNLRDYFVDSDFPINMYQTFIPGKKKTEVIDKTYSPDLMIKGKVYYADWGEWVSDWAKDTHCCVIADSDRTALTIDDVLASEDESVKGFEFMLNCLRSDIKHYRGKLEELPQADSVEKKEYIAKIDELETMKAIVEENYKNKLEKIEKSS